METVGLLSLVWTCKSALRRGDLEEVMRKLLKDYRAQLLWALWVWLQVGI